MERSYGVLGKMTAREIAKNLLQYLSMIIITMLAVTLFCGFVSNSKTLEDAIEQYKKDSNLCDFCVQTTGLDSADKEYFDGLDVEKEYQFYVEGKVENQSAKIYVGKGEITKPLVVSGQSGVLIDKKVAERNNLKVDDEITLTAMGLSFKLKITGTMNFIEVANTYSVCPIYIDEDLFNSKLPIKASSLYNRVLIKSKDGALKTQISNYFSEKETNNLLFIYDDSSFEAIVSLEGEVSQSLKMNYVFPVIFLLVSFLVILTTISQLILRERTNIGTLKAIGVPSGRILIHYASFGVVLCLIGGIIGAIIGPQIVTNVMQVKYNLVYSLPTMNRVIYSPIWTIIALVIITGLSAIISVIIASSVIKERPANCMRPLPPKDNFIVSRIVEKSKQKDKKKNNYHLSLKMAMRNILIKPSRAIMTIIGIAGCVALLLCSFGIGDTVNNSVDVELKKNYSYDISSTYNQQNESTLVEKLDTLKSEGTIEDYETYNSFYLTATSKNKVKDIFVYCYKPNSKFTKINVADGACLSKSVASTLGVKKGDEITLTFGSNVKVVKINKLVETAVTNGLFIDTEDFDTFQHTYNVWIKTNNADEVAKIVNDNNGTGAATTIGGFENRVHNMISSIRTIELTLMAFAIALSVVVLYNLSLLNIKERNRDIATIKVLGFTNNEIGSTLLYEIMILVVIGTLIGLLLGYPFVCLVLSINRVEVINFIYAIKPLSYLYSALISLVTGLVINLLFMPVIKKINMINSLKSVE